MADKSYIGYKAAPAIDWGKLTSEFSQGLMEIGARRGVQDMYFDKLSRDNMDAVRDTEDFQSQDVNTLVSGAVTQGVNNSYEMNKLVKSGKLNHNEYRNFMNNASSSWTEFSKTMKTIDQTIQTGLERQQVGEDGNPLGSQYEQDLIEWRTKLLDLKNKTIYQDPKLGKYFLAELNDEGIIGDPNNLQEMRNLNKQMNINDNFFNFNKLVKDRSSSLGEVTIGEMAEVDGKDIYVTEKGRVLNEDLPNAISRTQAYIRSNPRLIYNTLKQSDDRYQSFFNEEDYNNKMNDLVEIENGARQVRGEDILEEGSKDYEDFMTDNDKFLVENITDAQGVFQPNPNAEQRSALNAVVESTFMSNLGYSRVEAKPSTKGKGKGSGSGSGSGMSQGDANVLYKQLRNAWDKIETDPVQAAVTFTSQAVDGSEFMVKDGYLYKLIVENKWNKKEGRSVRTEKTVGPIKNMQDISTSFFGATGAKGAGKANTLYQNAEKKSGKEPAVMAMMEEQTEEIPADQMASNQGGNFLQRLARSGRDFLSGGDNQNIS
mgnify:CR=1 FL=1